MATLKSENLFKRDCDPDFIHKIVSWSQADVDKYLIKNGILGCGPALATNSIDGVAFLSLNYQSLTSWTIPIIKRSKIVALLNDLGSESYRKDVVVKAHISMRLQQAISNIDISQTPKEKSPGPIMTHSATIKPKAPRIGPTIPPKPGSLSKKPFVPPRNFQNGEPKRMDNIFFRDIAKENNVDNDESDYLVPISGGAEESIPEAINSRINSFNSSDGGSPFILISSDSFTDTDDEAHNSPIAANNSTFSTKKKKKVRKPGFIKHLLSKTSLSEERVSQDPLGTPPLPPVRNQDSSRWSSESSLSQSGSESQQTPPPQMLPFRKLCSQTATSMSSLAESHPPPTYPPPAVPPLPRGIAPFRRTSPAPRESSPFFGSRTASPCPIRNPRLPSTPQGSSPVQSPRSSNTSTDSESPKYAWFFNVDRRQSESLLRNLEDGTFLIRPSKHGGNNAFFTLSLQYHHSVFHILIRKRSDGKLALGSEKEEENTFHSLNELVQFHFDEAMQLHSSKRPAGKTRLTKWPENNT